MKKIVIDARISGTTTGRYVDKLIEYLSLEKPKEHITILTRTERVEYMKGIAPEFEVVESNFPDFSTGEQVGLKKQLDSLAPDLVHFPMVQQPVLYRGKVVTSMLDLTTLQFKNPAKNSVVFTAKQKVYKQVNRIAAKKSTHIITISDYVRDRLIDIFSIDPERITTTHNAAVKISAKPEPIPSLKGKKFIFYTGRPLPHKNLERLIDAFALINQTHPNLYLALGGKKDVLFERHSQYAQEIGMGSTVLLTDFLSEGQLRWAYENCGAYVFPSLSEGFGLPGLEAMVHDAPVVSSNATCLPEIYGDAAHYFDPLDVSDMASKICEVLDDKKLRESLVKKGYEQAKKYSWQRMAQQTLQIYRKVLAS